MTALRNSRQMQIAVLERVKAGARVGEAWSQALPNLDLGATYPHLGQAPTVTFNGTTVPIGCPGQLRPDGHGSASRSTAAARSAPASAAPESTPSSWTSRCAGRGRR